MADLGAVGKSIVVMGILTKAEDESPPLIGDEQHNEDDDTERADNTGRARRTV